MHAHLRLRPIVASTCLLLCGCVAKSTDGTTAVYTMVWYVGPGMVVAGLIVGAIGVVLFAKKHLYRGAILAIAGVVALFVSVEHFTKYLKISETELDMTNGNWCTRSYIRIKLDQLESVEVKRTESRGRYGTTREHLSLFCRIKDRGAVTVPLSDLGQAALPEILVQLDRLTVPIQGRELLASVLQ